MLIETSLHVFRMNMKCMSRKGSYWTRSANHRTLHVLWEGGKGVGERESRVVFVKLVLKLWKLV